ncbi:MAG: Translation machinery-associated protein 22 [Piccolia ochrophora]|nr:MAG: Translation machinery-associated protein 22 [Piccolia ochrophora]
MSCIVESCGRKQYCEFGGTVKKCREWLETKHPDMHERLYSDEAIESALSSLSVDAQKRAAKDSEKKAAKAEAAEAREQEKIKTAKVTIKKVERNKRKHQTIIAGLDAHVANPKKVMKELGKHFATGTGYGTTAAGVEEITLQGDVVFDARDWIAKFLPEIPRKNIVCLDETKKGDGG